MAEGNIETGCSVCDNLDVNAHADRWQAMQDRPVRQRIVKYLDLKEAASRGCKICSIVREGIEAFQGVLGQIRMETQVCFRCQPPLHSLEVGIQENKNVGNKWLEFFTLVGQPALWKAFGAANMVPERLDVNIAVRQIRQWLDDCEGHQGCTAYRRSLTTLPTRVLDLGKDPKSPDPIKLLETGGIEGTYMTLSHRWGPTNFITTTEDTFKQRIAGILLADLPQTFKDAVSLTRNLGIRYLWIDSLCIKQLDTKDWESEASKMGSVYSHSYLNIAATSSAGGDGGCFKERQVLIAQDPSPSAVRSHKIEGTDLGSGRINVRPLLKSAHRDLDSKGHSWSSQLSPLLSRAWVYQERILAPRTVHFHATEMLWECISSSRCECGGLDREQIATFRPNIFGKVAPRDVERQWFSVVQQYSGLNASRPSDKLPALSGIAEQFQAQLQCDYLAGLWRNHLLRGLQWVVADGIKCRRLPYRAPTWSWAALDQLSSTATTHHGTPVSYAFTKSAEQDNRLTVVEAGVSGLGKNPYGTINDGVLVLEAAFLTPSAAEIETEPSWVDEDFADSVLLLQFEGHENKIRVEPDIAFTSLPLGISQAPYNARQLRWLVLSKIQNRHYGLLLKPLEGQKDVYERVGLPYLLSPSTDLIDNAEVAKFKIV